MSDNKQPDAPRLVSTIYINGVPATEAKLKELGVIASEPPKTKDQIAAEAEAKAQETDAGTEIETQEEGN